MNGSQIVAQKIGEFHWNELIFASNLYNEDLYGLISEEAYYQALGRMCKSGGLCRIARGTYYRPKKSKYGIIPPSQKDIVESFTERNQGTVVGYSLYNNLKLTTQISKNVEVLSSRMGQQRKKINNIILQFCDLVYTPEVKNMIHMLDVLQNFSKIQELNYHQFIIFCENFSKEYDDRIFKQVIKETHYQKKTISFLRNILRYYGVENNLDEHLSALSKYNHPTMEEIYEAARRPYGIS